MSDEEQKTRAIESFLAGQADENNLHSKTLDRLFPRKLPDGELPDFAAARAKILRRRGKPAARNKPFLLRQFPLLAAAAVALLAIGLFFLKGSADAPAPRIAQPVTNPKKMQHDMLQGSVDVFYRQASAVTTSLDDKKLTLKANELTALFSFEPNAAVKNLNIETAHGTVSVIGTKFIVDANAGSLFVAVQSGKVRVSTAGNYYIVKAGEELRMSPESGKSVVSASAAGTSHLFTEITNAEISWPETLKRTTGEVSRQKSAQSITVTLENGTTIKGILQYEDATSLRLRVPAMGQKELTFRKSEILERQ